MQFLVDHDNGCAYGSSDISGPSRTMTARRAKCAVADVACFGGGGGISFKALWRRRESIFVAATEDGSSENLRIRSSARPHPLANLVVRGVVLKGDENLGRVGMKRSA